MGETQEEDRRLISDLITIKMQQALTIQGGQIPKRSSITQLLSDNEPAGQASPLATAPDAPQQQPPPQFTPRSGPAGFLQRMGSISGSIGNTLTSVASSTPGTSILTTNKFGSNTSIETSGNQTTSTSSQLQQQVSDTVDKTASHIRGLFRRASQTTNEDGYSTAQLPNANASTTTAGGGEDTEDTMKNLRKTFAGIFGEN